MGSERFSKVSRAFSVIRIVFYTTVILVSVLLASGIMTGFLSDFDVYQRPIKF